MPLTRPRQPLRLRVGCAGLAHPMGAGAEGILLPQRPRRLRRVRMRGGCCGAPRRMVATQERLVLCGDGPALPSRGRRGASRRRGVRVRHLFGGLQDSLVRLVRAEAGLVLRQEGRRVPRRADHHDGLGRRTHLHDGLPALVRLRRGLRQLDDFLGPWQDGMVLRSREEGLRGVAGDDHHDALSRKVPGPFASHGCSGAIADDDDHALCAHEPGDAGTLAANGWPGDNADDDDDTLPSEGTSGGSGGGTDWRGRFDSQSV
mmetsp:Transcript_16055/g.55867  ORF Transcript_16055/g.55867 Transcript_16055/m.55867 type:complete len:260 (+) Transcript_16055:1089-1868(+)